MPSARQAGLAGLNVITWNGVLAPAGTPGAILTRLHGEIVKVSGTQDMKDRMAAQAAEVRTTTPEEFSTLLRDDFAKWLKVIKAAGARAEN